MVDYYVGGGSAWSSGDDPTVWFNLDVDGHDSSLHATYSTGDIDAGDPFILLTNTGTLVAPAPALFLGLSGDYHIRIDEAGISGYNPNNSQWTGLMGGGAGGDSPLSIIQPIHYLGGGGFVDDSGNFGAILSVAFSDTNAKVVATFFVENGGDFKLRIMHSGNGANSGKTAGANIYFSYDVKGGGESWDVNGEVFDIPLNNANITDWDDSPTTVTIADNSRVSVYWSKDNSADGAAGNFYIYGFTLIRQ